MALEKKDNILSKGLRSRIGDVGARHAKATPRLVGKVAVVNMEGVRGQVAHADYTAVVFGGLEAQEARDVVPLQ